MATTTSLRPTSTSKAGDWAVTGAATRHAALSDNSDASYCTQNPTTEEMRLGLGVYTPPADHEPHRCRVRARCVRTATGSLQLFGSIFGLTTFDLTVTASPGTAIGDLSSAWKTVINPAGTTGQWWADQTSGAAGVIRVHEGYLDVDNRHEPTFTGIIRDGAEATVPAAGTITDTNRPTFSFDSPAYDGLNARSWTFRILSGATVVYEESDIGTPPSEIGVELANGTYTAEWQIFSTIRANDAFASDLITQTFTVAFTPPNPPTLTCTPDSPAVDLAWSTPGGGTVWDVSADVVTEIERTDCNGTTTIYAEQPGGLTGTFTDRFPSLSSDGVFCGEEDHDCEVSYRARHWGIVDDNLVTTAWSTPCVTAVDNPTPGNDWIHGAVSGDMSICPDRSWTRTRPFGRFQPIGGGLPTVITGAPGGRDYTLTIPLETYADLESLEAILAQQLVFYQPAGLRDQWMAPDPESGQVTKIGRVTVYQVGFVETGPQPIASPASFFTA